MLKRLQPRASKAPLTDEVNNRMLCQISQKPANSPLTPNKRTQTKARVTTRIPQKSRTTATIARGSPTGAAKIARRAISRILAADDL